MTVLVLGATGHIGRAVVERLRAAGCSVIAATRDAAHGEALEEVGAELTVLDVHDVPAVRAAMRRAERAFLLNPPADPAGDRDAEETRTAAAMVEALDNSGLAGVVAVSAYGATAEPGVGDLTVLHGLERQLAAQPVPAAVVRAAYLMSNWDAMVEPARQGVLPAMFPADFTMPMVAPADIGAFAARLLAAEAVPGGTWHVEGPARYSMQDVADAFGAALGRAVRVETIPLERFEATFREQGFSEVGARSFAKMTRSALEAPAWPEDVERGETSLEAYVAALVKRS